MKIQEVAEAAGVSIATVSRVLNHPELVQAETKERVLDIIQKNNYSPKLGLHGKKRERKNAIALILPSTSDYRDVFAGACSIGAMKNCAVQLYVTNNSEVVLRHSIRALIAQRIDGAIIAADACFTAALSTLKESGVPFVCIGGQRKPGNENMCFINYYESARKLAQYILDTGNQSVWLFLSKFDSDCKACLESAFFDAWHERGFLDDSVGVFTVDDSCKGGCQAFLDAVTCGSPIPDLVLAQNNDVAIGVVKAASVQKISVPKQMRIIGFNDTPISSMITPELTSVEHPTFRLGAVAARRLLDMLEDEDYFDVESQEIVLKGRLRIRKSCGNKKAIFEMYE